ncbi:hypothetical protein [Mesorhizobium silamurunense]|uniref:hypothetical protein n=1 Tax=Mesorhizobium silamurunense TaxID=499528 RepID=UPI001FE49D73|nr:hypothetical protein [Mesorhizobium silamurunense]
MTALARRPWVPAHCEDFIQALAKAASGQGSDAVLAAIEGGIALNRQIHEADAINLNAATNVMNPKAEAALASGLGSRPSLGYPGDKYEMGLEGVERIEVIAASSRRKSSARNMPKSACRPAPSPISMPSWPRRGRATPSSRRRRPSAAMSRII